MATKLKRLIYIYLAIKTRTVLALNQFYSKGLGVPLGPIGKMKSAFKVLRTETD